ncbi:hypothetical protein I553_6504 [Mycobacterium xenopi 4042]|uniref:Uncharacterized protein n=1 Tax=Mycobacterium xenopi 4042 TaxID=1299334 RepID=X8BFJ0_MYCXE|nr:hypothetical protein I553_6504 [Mycobacterium xenopi 4042]
MPIVSDEDSPRATCARGDQRQHHSAFVGMATCWLRGIGAERQAISTNC